MFVTEKIATFTFEKEGEAFKFVARSRVFNTRELRRLVASIKKYRVSKVHLDIQPKVMVYSKFSAMMRNFARAFESSLTEDAEIYITHYSTLYFDAVEDFDFCFERWNGPGRSLIFPILHLTMVYKDIVNRAMRKRWKLVKLSFKPWGATQKYRSRFVLPNFHECGGGEIDRLVIEQTVFSLSGLFLSYMIETLRSGNLIVRRLELLAIFDEFSMEIWDPSPRIVLISGYTTRFGLDRIDLGAHGIWRGGSIQIQRGVEVNLAPSFPLKPFFMDITRDLRRPLYDCLPRVRRIASLLLLIDH